MSEDNSLEIQTWCENPDSIIHIINKKLLPEVFPIGRISRTTIIEDFRHTKFSCMYDNHIYELQVRVPTSNDDPVVLKLVPGQETDYKLPPDLVRKVCQVFEEN